MQAHPEANEELKRFGVPRVPAVIVGDRAVHGWNPAGYAELVGVDYKPAVKLPPRILATRLDRILGSTEALVRITPSPEAYAAAVKLWTSFGDRKQAASVRADARKLFPSRRNAH